MRRSFSCRQAQSTRTGLRIQLQLLAPRLRLWRHEHGLSHLPRDRHRRPSCESRWRCQHRVLVRRRTCASNVVTCHGGFFCRWGVIVRCLLAVESRTTASRRIELLRPSWRRRPRRKGSRHKATAFVHRWRRRERILGELQQRTVAGSYTIIETAATRVRSMRRHRVAAVSVSKVVRSVVIRRRLTARVRVAHGHTVSRRVDIRQLRAV